MTNGMQQDAVGIDRLPPELLSFCLELSLVQQTANPQIGHSYKLLKAYALVSRRFSHVAQALLLSSVYLYHEEAALRFLDDAPSGDYFVSELRVFGDLNWENCENESTKGVVARCRGLKTLGLFYYERLDGTVLQCDTLCNLSTLRLSSLVHFPYEPTTAPLPFTLVSLSLDSYSYPHALIDALILSSANTLRHLSLTTYGDSRGQLDAAVTLLLAPVTRRLWTLTLPPLMTAAASEIIFPDLTSIRFLGITERDSVAVVAALRRLPIESEATLTSVSLALNQGTSIDDADVVVADFVDEVLAALERHNELRTLVVHFTTTRRQTALHARRRWEAEKECKARGIDLRIESY